LEVECACLRFSVKCKWKKATERLEERGNEEQKDKGEVLLEAASSMVDWIRRLMELKG